MKEIAAVFFRLGLLGFGGPIAVMAMMEEEVARKRRWVSRERFTEMLAVCKLLPGPVATQVAIYLGLERAGRLGGLLAGACFVLPSFIMVLGLSWLYVNTGVVQSATGLFAGFQAGALVVILLSTLQLAAPYRRRTEAWVIGLLSAGIVAFRPSLEPLVIIFSGAAGAWLARPVRRRGATATVGLFALGASLKVSVASAATAIASASGDTLLRLFWVCFKSGAFVFGTGLAIVPLLEADVVQRHQWLTHAAFMDGLAIGQITPGPVVITSTFIGYATAGLAGAAVATLGMFLPAFINVLFLVPPLWTRFSRSPRSQGFTAWALPAVIGAILGTLVRLAWMTLSSQIPIVCFALALGVALRFRPPAWVLIPLAGAAGMLLGLWS